MILIKKIQENKKNQTLAIVNFLESNLTLQNYFFKNNPTFLFSNQIIPFSDANRIQLWVNKNINN